MTTDSNQTFEVKNPFDESLIQTFSIYADETMQRQRFLEPFLEALGRRLIPLFQPAMESLEGL